ncbi:MAG: hypothetical protein ABW100_20855 [Candidatus Thiodiazotropha sp. 6PLUC3]
MNRLFLPLLLILSTPMTIQAFDLENGQRQARSCALCHGYYGQGTP